MQVANAGNTGITRLTVNGAAEYDVEWAPDGSKLVYSGVETRLHELRGPDLHVMNPDGDRPGADHEHRRRRVPARLATGPRQRRATRARRARPRCAFTRADLPVVHGAEPHARAAARLRVLQLRPRTPGQLTVGTPDANGRPTKSVSIIQIGVRPGIASTPADEADLRLFGTINDVRLASDLSDYTGTLEARMSLRITDRDNTPHPAGRSRDHPGPDVLVPDPVLGHRRHVDRRRLHLRDHRGGDRPRPIVEELRRSVWELGSMRIFDGRRGRCS